MMSRQKTVATVSLSALFIAFLKVAFCGLGGGLVWARRIAVEQRRWISEEEFTDILGVCQFMPGPNIVGIAVCTGAKLRGLAGAVAAASGFVLIPLTMGFLLGLIYLSHAHLGTLQNVLGGASAAAAGLLIATGIRMLIPCLHRPPALIVAACAFGGMSFTQLPLLAVLFGATLLSIVITAAANGVMVPVHGPMIEEVLTGNLASCRVGPLRVGDEPRFAAAIYRAALDDGTMQRVAFN